MIMWTYYCLVWAVTLCNVLRTAVQLIGGASSEHGNVPLWNVLWLITRFIMTMLEVRPLLSRPPARTCGSGAAVSTQLLSP